MGIFDGVHIGHQKILKKVRDIARKENLKSVVITFLDLPKRKIIKTNNIFIKSIDLRIQLIKEIGVDYIILFKIKKISKISPEKFLKEILINKLKMKYIVVGKDFKFGKNLKGDVKFLNNKSQKYDYKAVIINDVKFADKRISSTLIKNFLQKGKIKEVEKMLGRKYFIEGKVVKGKQIGFSFPTANIKFDFESLPIRGVWVVIVEYKNKKFGGVANIGFAPTLKKEKKLVMEVHILDFNKNIYGEYLKIIFIKKLRDEKKFKTKKELINQVKKDIMISKKILKKEGLYGCKNSC